MQFLICCAFRIPDSFRVFVFLLAFAMLSFCQADDAETEVEFFRRAIGIDPKNAQAHVELGIALGKQGKLDEAIESIRRAIELAPELATAHYDLGVAFENHGKQDEAIESYRRAIKFDPEFREAHENLGIALGKQGKLDEAIESFRRAIKLDPESPNAHHGLGYIMGQQGKVNEAIESIRRAIRIDPQYGEAHGDLGAILIKQGRVNEAIESSRRAIELMPEHAEAHSNLGSSLAMRGDLDEAIEFFRRALELEPASPQASAVAHSGLGAALGQQGKMDEAIIFFRRAIELDPEYSMTHSNLGNVFLEQGKMDEAIESYRRAIGIDPKNLNAIMNLINVYAKTDQIDLCGIWSARWGLAKGLTAQASLVSDIKLSIAQVNIEIPAEQPTDQAVRAYYKANKETLSDIAVHLRTLTIPKSRKTREFVDELRAELVAGNEDFATAAKKYSFDNASPNGGDRGWVKRGELPAELLDAAFALKAGEISAVIEDGSHYRILDAVEHRDGNLVPIEKVREQIVGKLIKERPSNLIREARAKRIKEWIEQARKEHAGAMDGA